MLELQSKSRSQITLLGNAQLAFTTLLAVGLLIGISAYVQLLVQIINNILVSNFLHFCCIRNPT